MIRRARVPVVGMVAGLCWVGCSSESRKEGGWVWAGHAVLTSLRGAGIEVDSFGADEGYVSTGIPELEV